MNIKKIQWGEYKGKAIWLYSIKNEDIEVNLTNYGCTIVSILVSGSLLIQKKADEGQIDEKHVDERYVDEMYVDEKQVSEKQANEKHVDEKWLKKDNDEKQVDGKLFNEIGLNRRNVILGYADLEELLADKYYMGSIVGRYAGRISKSCFEIDGTKFYLPANDGTSGNHLHGGPDGFNKMVFTEISQHCTNNEASVSFQGISGDLDQGYPGNLHVNFSINLNSENEITFSYLAKTDRPTHINLTHHLYYNLCDDTLPATAQNLLIDTDSMVETNDDYIPTGKILPIPQQANFLVSRKIPGDTDFNECYVLNISKEFGNDSGDKNGSGVKIVSGDNNDSGNDNGNEYGNGGGKENMNYVAAILSDPASGLAMHLTTTCPAIIFYSGQFLDIPFYPKQGICLEAQYFPDAPNHKNFPSTLYTKGKHFEEQTKLSFKKIS